MPNITRINLTYRNKVSLKLINNDKLSHRSIKTDLEAKTELFIDIYLHPQYVNTHSNLPHSNVRVHPQYPCVFSPACLRLSCLVSQTYNGGLGTLAQGVTASHLRGALMIPLIQFNSPPQPKCMISDTF